jgi:hypothetical protein
MINFVRFLTLAVCLLAFGGKLVPSKVRAAPVLVLTDDNAANPFGVYATEILRGEGLLAFEQRDRTSWSADPNASSILAGYGAVVMSEMELSLQEQQMLRNYVQSGGVLIASRPAAGLSDVFGIQQVGNRPEHTLQYYGVDAAHRPANGITHGALQFHGGSSNYNLQGATTLANFYSNASTPTSSPAVTTHEFGQGKAVAFAFDPAKSVALTRQGNPDWQNTEGDGLSQYRPHDFFARTDGRTWYDPSLIGVPHADEMQRFLVNVLIDTNEAPLPRMWYLPGTHKSIMINTGDGEDNFGAQFDRILDDAASYGGKFTVYLRDIGVTNTSAAKEAEWRADGHEVGVHVYADGVDGAGAVPALTSKYNNIVMNVANKFGHSVRTARSHTIDWTGWVDMARIEANAGTQLDTNFYHYLNGSVVNPLTTNGYFTGSGLPQRFIDESGDLLDIYQAATQWPDEWFADNGVTAQQAFAIMKTMFEKAESEGYYSAFVNNVHPVRYYGSDNITAAWTQAIWAYAQSKGIPMWSAEMLLDFSQARNESQFANIAHSNGLFEFDYVAGDAGEQELTIMIPADWDDARLNSITVDGNTILWSIENIKGIEYAMFTPQIAQAHIVASYLVSLPGDYNANGIVDAADYTVWRDNLGSAISLPNDDTAGVGLDDFSRWKTNFGQTVDSGSGANANSAVPEPATTVMLILTMAGLRLQAGRNGGRATFVIAV